MKYHVSKTRSAPCPCVPRPRPRPCFETLIFGVRTYQALTQLLLFFTFTKNPHKRVPRFTLLTKVYQACLLYTLEIRTDKITLSLVRSRTSLARSLVPPSSALVLRSTFAARRALAAGICRSTCASLTAERRGPLQLAPDPVDPAPAAQ